MNVLVKIWKNWLESVFLALCALCMYIFGNVLCTFVYLVLSNFVKNVVNYVQRVGIISMASSYTFFSNCLLIYFC